MKIIILDDRIERWGYHHEVFSDPNLSNFTIKIISKYPGDSYKYAECDYLLIHNNNKEAIDIRKHKTEKYIKIFFSGGFSGLDKSGEDIYVETMEIKNYFLDER